MRRTPRTAWLSLVGLAAVTAAPLFVRAEAADSAAATWASVLETSSYWRAHVTLRPTVFGTCDRAVPDVRGTMPGFGWTRKAVLPLDGPVTPPPPADWVQPDFDDGTWWRQTGPFYGGEMNRAARVRVEVNLFSRYGHHQPISMALLSLRGRFAVDDPSRVEGLRLTAAYRGGLVVYLNGREVARRHMPDGPVTHETLAAGYPADAWFDAQGALLSPRECGKSPDRFELRVRRAEGVDLPADALRRGVNVLGLEFHRAAQHPKTLDYRPSRQNIGAMSLWNTVGCVEARVEALGAGIHPNVTRPAGVSLWNANPLESLFDDSYGDPNEPLRPVRIVGARNGTFSGQVVVSSDGAIGALEAAIGPFKHEAAARVILADCVQLRFPQATILERGARPAGRTGAPANRPRFDALFDAPASACSHADRPRAAGGMVQPVWLTVRVPADAVPGRYRATLALRASGRPLADVPVEVDVHDFALPDPANFRTSVGFLEMPESLADQYGLAAWSEKHWQMIARSMALLARTGNQVLYVPLIAGTHFGNRQTMVRWVKDGDGFRHDLSLLERYLDTALKAGVRPQLVCVQVWDYHIGSSGRGEKIGTGRYGQSEVFEPQPVPVSRMDPASGEIQEWLGPRYTDPGAEAFWRPVAAGVRAALAKRDLDRAAALGICGDYVPAKSVVDLWARLLPDAPWVTMAHGTTPRLHGQPVGYATAVFGASFVDPALERKRGWQRPDPVAYFPRYAGNAQVFGLAYERTFHEFGLLCGLRGAGRQVLDDFRDPYDRRGRGTDCSWGSLTPGPAWLAPGPDGPVATARFEMGIEGIQECEARIFIEEALTDEARRARLGSDLAVRCQRILDERTRSIAWANEQNTNQRLHCYLPLGPLGSDWYAGSGWQGRSDRLYSAAADVARALGGVRMSER